MDIKRIIINQWKTLILVGSLVFLAPVAVWRKPQNFPDVSLLSIAEPEDRLDFFKDFVFVPNSALLVDEDHILALYKNSSMGLYALAMFTADCDLAGCTLEDLVAYSVFDPEDQDSEDYNEYLQAKSQEFLQGNEAACLGELRRAGVVNSLATEENYETRV